MHTYGNTELLLRALNAPRRNYFFYGKRMDVQHFEMEQGYGKLKQWLLNRLTLGKGVLCGLRVSVDGQRVCVDPGVAIDGLGREIIVPVRACIDPFKVDEGCCGRHYPESRSPSSSPADTTDTHGHPRERPSADTHEAATGGLSPTTPPSNSVFTLWVCYHECLADYQPVLVSDCNTRNHCAAGTVVESFCLKTTPGLPPLQGDPDWCEVLWKKESTPLDTGEHPSHAGGMTTHVSASAGNTTNALGLSTAETVGIRETLQSRRYALCKLFDDTCEPPEGDPCVPLALIIVREGRLFVESCLVRPRIYSNAKLLELILCLTDKIDECCNKTVDLLRVRSIEFINRSNAVDTPVTSVPSPLQDTLVDINRNPNAIRIRFSKPFAANNQHRPTTHGRNDQDFAVHNVQVLPEKPLRSLKYVPGRLEIETPDTIRFDLLSDSPYMREDGDGWQKGRYRIFLRGNENLTNNWQALADADANHAFDGEPIAPTGGVMSGDGTSGGDFVAHFVIGPGEQTHKTMRVRSIEFLTATNQVIQRMISPRESTVLNVEDNLQAIRIQFTKALALGNRTPTTHAAKDPDYQKHNVQVLSLDANGTVQGFVPGTLHIDAADTLTFLLAIPAPRTRGPLPWPLGSYRLLLAGTDDVAHGRLALADRDGLLFDGEAIAPTNEGMSGDSTPGGDFTADFIVQQWL